jgi:hypothetical protein
MVNDSLPRIIWVFWNSGWDNAPEIVKKCIDTWKEKNPDWTIHQLSDTTIGDFIDLKTIIPGIDQKNIQMEALSDIIRISLLHKYGGVWADSTIFCNQSLNDWIYEASGKGFFAFSKPGPDRMIASWFLAAHKNNYIIEKWYHAMRAYWLSRTERHHYFWFHYLFGEIYNSDKIFKDIWDSTTVLSADGPHYFVPYDKMLSMKLTRKIKNSIDHPVTTMFKLTHKYDKRSISKKSVLNYLLKPKNLSKTPSEMLLSKIISFFKKEKKIVIDKSKPLKILVSWYGAFDGHGTIGDLLSVQSVTRYLSDKGYDIDCTSYKKFNNLSGRIVNWKEVDARDYQIFIFVCGPIMKDHPQLAMLFGKFKNCVNIGIGVSLFKKGHFNYFNPFDHVFAREGTDEVFEDVAIVAPGYKKEASVNFQKKEIIIGISMRGEQGEYGIEKCLFKITDQTINDAAAILAEKWNGKVLLIENHLEKSGTDPEEIDAMYERCHLVITSRLHGCLMALRHAVPFIAIDQIKGGAKLYTILKDKKWPYVYKIDDVASVESVVAMAEEIVSGKYNSKLLELRKEMLEGGENSLMNIDKYIQSLVK